MLPALIALNCWSSSAGSAPPMSEVSVMKPPPPIAVTCA
jgi:hypothetical protein